MFAKQKAVIFDMDGTLVNVSTLRSYLVKLAQPVGLTEEEFDEFHAKAWKCEPIWDTLSHVDHWRHIERAKILVVTARSNKYRDLTQSWLDKYSVWSDRLYMRGRDDKRDDVQVKADLLDNIKKEYDVVHAFEDNPAIVTLWTENKIPTSVVPGWVSV